MERMKASLEILQKKLEANEDAESQVQQYIVSFQSSESIRATELQAQIQLDAKNVIVESTKYQETLKSQTSSISGL